MSPFGTGATGLPLASQTYAWRFPKTPAAARPRKPLFSSGTQNCLRTSFTSPGFSFEAVFAAFTASAAKRSPVAFAWMYCVAVLEWFSDPLGTTVGSVCGSSIEPLSPTRYMLTPPPAASTADCSAPGQSALRSVPEFPISWLCAPTLATVKIGFPSAPRAWRTPIFGSTAAIRSSFGSATSVGNSFERRCVSPDRSG